MEHMFKRFLALTTLIACFGASAADNDNVGRVTPKITIRSQGTNALRRLVGTADMMNLYDNDCWNGFFSIMPEYTRTFNNSRITECLFGISEDCNSDCGTSLLVQGIDVENRSALALDARNFGLPSDFSSTISFSPRIQNFLVDFFGYVGLDSCYEGLYAWIQFPVTWTKWDLGFCERVLEKGENAVPAGVISPEEVSRELLQPNAQAFFAGKPLASIVQGDTTINFAALECGKICGDDTKTAVSEVRFALGYNFLLCEDYHFGLNLQASAPTGNKVCSNFLFAAQNGNDKHWELGVGIDAHAILWRCEDEESHLGFYLDANITHMFNSSQRRCFDLCGKPLSRYMLAARLDAPNTDNAIHEDGDLTSFPATVFNNAFSPIGNLTSFNVDVKVAVNADVVAMFNYTCGNWSWDLGYNFWGRSCEKLSLDCKCPTTFAEDTWVIAGDASFFGCEVGGAAHALSPSESEATIRGGTNFTTLPPFSPAQISAGLGNEGVDNAEVAAFGPADLGLFVCSLQQGNEISTSIQPIFIKQSDINFAKTQGISNKVFSHIGYNWECDCWSQFFGVGFEAEFGQHNGDKCDNDCDTDCKTSCKDDCDDSLRGDCVRCAISQWGIWVKGGVAFN